MPKYWLLATSIQFSLLKLSTRNITFAESTYKSLISTSLWSDIALLLLYKRKKWLPLQPQSHQVTHYLCLRCIFEKWLLLLTVSLDFFLSLRRRDRGAWKLFFPSLDANFKVHNVKLSCAGIHQIGTFFSLLAIHRNWVMNVRHQWRFLSNEV